MRPELLRLADELARRGEPFALATVVARQAPSSARLGDAALVTGAGEFHGWIGGSCTRPTVIVEARAALADGAPRLIALSPDPDLEPRHGLAVFPMTCRSGGSVEIHIQPVLPAPQLFVFGLSPTARALCRLASAMGYRVEAIDPEADATAFPAAAELRRDPAELPAPAPRPGPASRVFAVVATQGEWDEEAILAALSLAPDYLGVVASRKRFAELREFVEARSKPGLRARLAVMKGPAGLDIGARAPEEIALSILAEIVERRPRAEADESATATATPRQSVDPVCGMTVALDSARHRATHAGLEYAFCCAGCRLAFLESPERYASVGT